MTCRRSGDAHARVFLVLADQFVETDFEVLESVIPFAEGGLPIFGCAIDHVLKQKRQLADSSAGSFLLERATRARNDLVDDGRDGCFGTSEAVRLGPVLREASFEFVVLCHGGPFRDQ